MDPQSTIFFLFCDETEKLKVFDRYMQELNRLKVILDVYDLLPL